MTKVRPVFDLREQCLRSKITSVARVAHVLLSRFVAGNMEVNTPASKRSQLTGNTAIVRKRRVIHKKSTSVGLLLSVAAFTRKRRHARFDLWPALDVLAISNSISLTHVASNVTIGVRNRRVSRSGVWHW